MTWDWLPEAVLLLLGGGGGGGLVWGARRFRRWLIQTRGHEEQERNVDAADRLSNAAARQVEGLMRRIEQLEVRVDHLESELEEARDARLSAEAATAGLRASVEIAARELARESDDRWSALWVASPVGILRLSIESGVIADANPAACEILGRPRRLLLGSSWQMLVVAEEHADLIEATRLLASGARSQMLSTRQLLRGDGSQLRALVSTVVIRAEGGSCLLVQVVPESLLVDMLSRSGVVA